MSGYRMVDAAIDAFLADGIIELPDRTFEAVRADIHRTRQRTFLGPLVMPRRWTVMQLAVAAAIIFALGVSFGALEFAPGPGAPTATPATSNPASPTGAGVRIVGSGPGPEPTVYPGRWVIKQSSVSDALPPGGPEIEFTVTGSGWITFSTDGIVNDGNGLGFAVWKIVSPTVHGCSNHALPSETPGPGIDELLEALAAQPAITAGPITPVSVDGYVGKYVELTAPYDIACNGGFYVWNGRFVQYPQETNRVYAIDVDGFRLTFFLRIPHDATAAQMDELEALIASIDIQP